MSENDAEKNVVTVMVSKCRTKGETRCHCEVRWWADDGRWRETSFLAEPSAFLKVLALEYPTRRISLLAK